MGKKFHTITVFADQFIVYNLNVKNTLEKTNSVLKTNVIEQ